MKAVAGATSLHLETWLYRIFSLVLHTTPTATSNQQLYGWVGVRVVAFQALFSLTVHPKYAFLRAASLITCAIRFALLVWLCPTLFPTFVPVNFVRFPPSLSNGRSFLPTGTVVGSGMSDT